MTLRDLTGKDKGLILIDQRELITCFWGDNKGLPWYTPGLQYLLWDSQVEIPETEPCFCNQQNIFNLIKDSVQVYIEDRDIPKRGFKYEFSLGLKNFQIISDC